MALLVSLSLWLALPAAAGAALGEATASVEADRFLLKAARTLRTESGTAGAYEVHELAHATGVVREYAAGGKVFAVSWRGTTAPPLRELLGGQFAAFNAAVRTGRRGHHSMNFSTGELSASLVRFQRGFAGHVALTKLSPAGLALDALQ